MRKLFLLVLFTVIIVGCKQVDYTASDGSILTITANPTIVTLNGGTSQITVMGQRKGGAPLTDGTVIYFTVDIGRIEPERIETKGGFAKVIYISDNRSGEATVAASSGLAEKVETKLTVGTKAFGSIELQAKPPVLPREGGKTELTARVLDTEGAAMPNIPVYFTTNGGTLSSNSRPQYTNTLGIVKDTLTTSVTATVTAAVGDKTAEVTVNVGDCEGDGCNKKPTPIFIYSPQPAVMNQSTFFDASQSYDSDGSIAKYEWTFGDGSSGKGVRATHVYTSSTAFVVVLKVTDNLGLWDTTSQTVQVNAASCSLSVTWGANDSTGDNDGTLEIQEKIQFVATTQHDPCSLPSNDPCCIASYIWTFGDDTQTPSDQPIVTHTYIFTGPKTVTLTIRNRQLSYSSPSSQIINIFDQQIRQKK